MKLLGPPALWGSTWSCPVLWLCAPPVPHPCPTCAGISGVPDAEGFQQYQRPEGKSGGHGVGWSEIPRYKFRVPGGWEETPVSIADLGGTEVWSKPWEFISGSRV